MTIKVGSNAQGHHSHMLKRARIPVPPGTGRTIKRTGIARLPDRKPHEEKPLSDRHLAILRMVDIEDPISASEIAEVLHLNPHGVNSGLYVLQRRGLVLRVPYKGWVKPS